MIRWKTFLLSATLGLFVVTAFDISDVAFDFLCNMKVCYVITVVDNSRRTFRPFVRVTFWAAFNSVHEMHLIRLKESRFPLTLKSYILLQVKMLIICLNDDNTI